MRGVPSNRVLQCLAAAAFGAGLLTACAAEAQETFVSLGSGPSTGVYYKVAKALCSLVNRTVQDAKVRCSPEATPGSTYNLDRLLSGELDFALVQSDLQQDAWEGRPPPAQRGLRSVLSLHDELITVVARADAGLLALDGLKGKRVNAGAIGSGTRSSWDEFAATFNWTLADTPRLSALRPDAATDALCSGKIDASVSLVGHPSLYIKGQLSACDTDILPLDGPAVDRFLADHQAYHRAVIEAAPYGMQADVPTLGVTATLLTRADMDEAVVRAVVQAVLADLDEFRSRHPALAHLKAEEMKRRGLTAPLHPGAVRAFAEAGIR